MAVINHWTRNCNIVRIILCSTLPWGIYIHQRNYSSSWIKGVIYLQVMIMTNKSLPSALCKLRSKTERHRKTYKHNKYNLLFNLEELNVSYEVFDSVELKDDGHIWSKWLQYLQSVVCWWTQFDHMRDYSSGHLTHPITCLFLQSFVAFFSLLFRGFSMHILKFHEDCFISQCVEQNHDKGSSNSIAVYIINTYSPEVTLSLHVV